ncbi:MAG: thioredoxin family protein [Myxococcaceae bacterium]
MALTSNTPITLGTPCPDFKLESVEGKICSLSDFDASKALLIAFICNHCPYVRKIEDALIALKIENCQVVAICSNDFEKYPDDAPEALLKRWHEKNYGFPYLIDRTQEVAKAFDAACTPDLFLYDSKRALYYHGRIEELENAVKDLLADKAAPKDQPSSIGCSIKWA